MTYDPSSGQWFEGIMSAPEIVGTDGSARTLDRSHHIQFTDSLGNVIIAGGVRYASQGGQKVAAVAPETLWLDSTDPNAQFHAILKSDGSPFLLGRANASGAGVLGNGALAIGGGDLLDGTLADPPVAFFDFNPDAGAIYSPGSLDQNADDPLRTHAATTAVGADRRMLILAGGLAQDGSLLASSTVADSTDGAVHTHVDVARGRIDPCAVTLPDGRAVVIGGEVPGLTTSTEPWADLYSAHTDPNLDGGAAIVSARADPAADMLDSRKWQTCTVLQDGSVLVTGGVKEEGGNFEVLDSIELYTPVPL